jgi:hypothetical protein
LASPLNVGQVTRAVDALLKHTRNTKNAGKAQLIESDDPISVLIGMKSIPDTGRRTTPYMMWATLPSIHLSLSLSLSLSSFISPQPALEQTLSSFPRCFSTPHLHCLRHLLNFHFVHAAV